MKNVTSEQMRLYAVTDRSWIGEKTLCQQVEEAIKGGVTFVQLREKQLSDEEILEEGKQIKALCKKYGVPFVMNDRVDLALALDADGVHVGQKDMEAGQVRKLLGPDKIIGVSARTVEQALAAKEMGADYLGVGAVFQTGTKGDAVQLDHAVLKQICETVDLPIVAIGGIKQENVKELTGSGVSGIAVVSAIFAQPDIQKATEALRKASDEMVQGASL